MFVAKSFSAIGGAGVFDESLVLKLSRVSSWSHTSRGDWGAPSACNGGCPTSLGDTAVYRQAAQGIRRT